MNRLLYVFLIILFPFMISGFCGEKSENRAYADEMVRPDDLRKDISGKIYNLSMLKKERKLAANRKRRIIYNNDGCDLTHYTNYATENSLVYVRFAGLIGTQVDTIVYNTSKTFSLFTHNTKIGEVFSCKEQGYKNNKTQDFIDQGTDGLQIISKFCHENGFEFFWSMRMNDIHDAYSTWYSTYLFPKLKKKHPEYLVGKKEKRPNYGEWTAVDYTHEEIRELAFRFVEEVCQNYNVDGIELDFMRTPLFFNRQADGLDLGDKEREMMTDLMRRIRKMIEEVGIKRGRPILVSVRVPDSVGYCRAIGIDIEKWLEAGLVDMMVAGGDWHLNPWDVSVALGKKYDVPVYPCLSNPTKRSGASHLTPECWRGRAQNAWASGADGIYIFNFFNSSSLLWHQIGDVDSLKELDKIYTSDAYGIKSVNRFLANGERFLNRKTVSQELPVPIQFGKSTTVDVNIGEQFDDKHTYAEILLKIKFENIQPEDKIQIKLNNVLLNNAKIIKNRIEYFVESKLLCQGLNQVTFDIICDAAKGCLLRDLFFFIKK